jgi:ligand-binding SRPBCC domain-containing protein
VAHFRLQTLIRAPVERVFDLARDIDFHQRSMVESHERAVGGRTSGLIEMGEEVEWEARHFGMTLRLRSRITFMDPPHIFVDEQVKGPFVHFVHRHEFQKTGSNTTMMDDWTHTAPLGFIADPIFLGRYMQRLLEARNDLLRKEAEARR